MHPPARRSGCRAPQRADLHDMAMTQPTVSIILPVYNGARYLAAAIESVLAQTYRAIQLIIVNDCATDNSDQIIRRYLHDPRITYRTNNTNLGVATSRNVALECATGELIAFHDQDDLWLPVNLELKVAAFRNHPEVGLLHSRYARIDAQGALLPAYRVLAEDEFGNSSAQVNVANVFEEIFVSNDIQPLTSVVPKKVLDEVGWFNPDLPGVDDYELWLRIARRHLVGHLQTITGYWRMHSAQQSKQGYKMLLIRLKAMETLLSADPSAARLVNRKAFVQRMHGMNRGAANHYFYNMQDYQAAREYLVKCIRLRLTDFDSLAKLGYCSLPPCLRNSIRWTKRKLVS